MEMVRLLVTASLIIIINNVGVQGTSRPIWNYGHMVNSVTQIDEFLNLGANAIEADVTFNSSGVAEYTYHGFPCDCFRSCRRWEYVDTYFQHIEAVSNPDSDKYKQQLVLLGMDLKFGSLYDNQKAGAMRNLAERLLKHVWKNGQSKTKIRLLFHIPSVEDTAYLKPFLDFFDDSGFSNLKKQIGFEVYSRGSLDDIGQQWIKLNITSNIWQGDGITNCFPRGTARIISAIQTRDKNDYWIKKVFWWTVDKWGSIRSILRIGVDGVMSNHPDRVKAILQEDEFKDSFRLATSDDDPFQHLTGYADYSGGNVDVPSFIFNVDPNEEVQEED